MTLVSFNLLALRFGGDFFLFYFAYDTDLPRTRSTWWSDFATIRERVSPIARGFSSDEDRSISVNISTPVRKASRRVTLAQLQMTGVIAGQTVEEIANPVTSLKDEWGGVDWVDDVIFPPRYALWM